MILKIDTTGQKDVKIQLVFDGGKKYQLAAKQKLGSQTLLPLIAKILKTNKISIWDLSGIEVDAGPGSFTGTRVGVSVANALGFALNIPVNGKKDKIVDPKYQQSKFDQK